MIKREVLKRVKAHFKLNKKSEFVEIEHEIGCASSCDLCSDYQNANRRSGIYSVLKYIGGRPMMKRYYLGFLRMPVLMDTMRGHSIKHIFINERVLDARRAKELSQYTWKV